MSVPPLGRAERPTLPGDGGRESGATFECGKAAYVHFTQTFRNCLNESVMMQGKKSIHREKSRS